jgi:hypothetical protein
MADMLDAIQAAFAAQSYTYQTFTLGSGRKLRVVVAQGTPDAGLTAHLSFDGCMVEWPEVRKGRRLMPFVATYGGPDQDAAFHAAHLLDWALSKGVPPRPGEIVLTLGHSAELPHVRFDYPFPWEQARPFEIHVDDLIVIPVMAYSISEAEARLQLDQGAKALEALYAERSTRLFDRKRTGT